MKIVIIGGAGLIGSKIVRRLTERGYEAVAASRRTGVDSFTGKGLAKAMAGAQVVVDVSKPSTHGGRAALEFFETSTRNLLSREAAAGVGHHVALSVTGVEGISHIGWMRAKLAQEKQIRDASIPYSIVRSTQFFEFVAAIADSATVGNAVQLPPVFLQPIAADDVADVVTEVAIGAPLNGFLEIAGPERFRLDAVVGRVLRRRNDTREVAVDSRAGYFGGSLGELSLVPGGQARLGKIRFADWLRTTTARIAARGCEQQLSEVTSCKD
ncbi:MAG: NAD(P)H-binding protein [Acidobacteria bacterium]|nr:NAD(P)H-binding protein [Acidobacteriota bacterium]